jgi:glycine/D-amino acid oxidase-like deaminating enzyme
MPQNKEEHNGLSSPTGGQGAYIIVGQGICGTLLSYYLHKEGKSFVVIDDGVEDSASKVAAGIINPVTGRRYVASWMIEELIAFAHQTYSELGDYLNTKFIFQKNIIDFFPSEQMRNAFVNRITEDDTYVHSYPDQNRFNQYFNYDFGCGEVRPAYIVNLQILLASWRKKIMDMDALITEKFENEQLTIRQDSVSYKNIHAQKIIFCNGINAMENPWFKLLPFSAVKGEALIIETEELTNEHIFKKGLMLAPLPVQNTFWVGSNYQWEFENNLPSESFYQQTNAHLKQWLKAPFKILFHKAAIRPATIERRPFVGLHPQFQNLGILNGMGTKGISLAPFFANQLAQHLVHGLPLMNEVNISRFNRILSLS